MKEDLVSIVVPVYNCEKFIRQTINTVKKQTYNNVKIGASNDALMAVGISINALSQREVVNVLKNQTSLIQA